MKHIRQDKDTKKSGAGAKKIKKYIYHDQLQFLKKLAKPHDTESSINITEGNNPVTPTEDIIDDLGIQFQRSRRNQRLLEKGGETKTSSN